MTDHADRFTIQLDHDEAIVLITMAGFLDDATMAAFETEMARVVGPLATTDRLWSNIGDARDLPPQSADIVARHTAVFERYAGVWGDRVALVIPRALTRSQARRVVREGQPHMCDSLAAARSWVIAARDRRGPAA